VIKRTVELSAEPAHLTARLNQLLIQRHGQTAASIPCEDIGVLVVDEPQTTYSQAALSGLARSDAVLVVCGADHLPAALLLPLADHHEVVWRVAQQVAVGRPLRKRLWKQLVRAKIRGQAVNLDPQCPARQKLLELAKTVRSGDPANVEAHAAQVYWKHWLNNSPRPLGEGPESGSPRPLGEGPGVRAVTSGQSSATSGPCPANLKSEITSPQPLAPSPSPNPQSSIPNPHFRRDQDGDGINAMLNYGYAIVRAAVARALVAAGLLPALGLFHANRGNAFCLADDLMEPLRPLVDRRVRVLWRAGHAELNPEVKRGLLELLTERVRLGGQRGPLMVSLHRMTASLVRCYEGQSDRLEIPQPCTLADTDVCGF
jgi:CRISPR/Cas system-associated endonuclease Cas1